MRLVLASASPRRAELLRAAGYTFEIVACDVDESMKPGESPSTYVRRLAAEKSAAAMAALNGSASFVILGADTTVVVDGEILGKPRDDDEAAAMLQRLAGRRHEVLTAVSLRQGAYELGRVETTAVWFLPLTKNDIDSYVASGECRDKAGAYALQGVGAGFIPRDQRSHSRLVGVPLRSATRPR